MKTILVTGTSGMLGGALVRHWRDIYRVGALSGREQFDFSQDSYDELKKRFNPDCIIHSAAITNIEYCEDNVGESMMINGESVRKLTEVFPKAKMIFISSDAVFPSNTQMAIESDLVDPQTVYGKSKTLGEKYTGATDKGISVRTTIVGKNVTKLGHSLSEWIVESLRAGKSITLYDDVWFTPIDVWHFADALEWVIANEVPGTLHIGGGQRVTKYDYGLALARAMKLPVKLIKKGKLPNIKSLPKRSSEMSLDSTLYTELSGHKLPDLEEVVRMMAAKYYQ